MILDFTEIPEANKGGGQQDTFELFARDFLRDIGYKIIQDPSRGSDGKKDLIVEETRRGIGDKKTKIIWLVSCKHYAHSGKAITHEIELEIRDRLDAANCDAFMGFYSTIPATYLSDKLNDQNKYEFETYDCRKIEKLIISSRNDDLMIRYFPMSYQKYKDLRGEKEIEKESRVIPDEISSPVECLYNEKVNAVITANVLLEIDTISDDFFSDWNNNNEAIDRLRKYSKYSNKLISQAVMDFVLDASHLTRGNLPSGTVQSFFSTVLVYFPTSYHRDTVADYDIENGITATNIAFNIAYDSTIYTNNLGETAWGLTILKHVYKYGKKKKIKELTDAVLEKYSELESTLKRPERNDLGDAQDFVKYFKKDLDTHSLSFPPMTAHLYSLMN